MNHHEVEVALTIAELPEALAAAADGWGAEWRADESDRDGGRLVLPVVFVLRRVSRHRETICWEETACFEGAVPQMN